MLASELEESGPVQRVWSAWEWRARRSCGL